MTLVNWTYTRDEWKAFNRLLTRNRNIFYRLLLAVMPASPKAVPTVSITPEKVWIGKSQEYFSSGRHELQHIDLRNEGSVNVLSIRYDRDGIEHEIKIPVPKGKLREAIEVQDRLFSCKL